MTSILFFEFWFLLLVLVIFMMDYVVFIEFRIILLMDHVRVQVRVRVLSYSCKLHVQVLNFDYFK